MSPLEQTMTLVATEVETVLKDLLPQPQGSCGQLAAAMRYSTLEGGKRFRPFLLIATGEMFDGPRPTLLRAAAAVEFIHAYSLIHDDLPAMDDGQLRRGRPTCHRAFDEATAILAGDALQALAFDVLARNDYGLDPGRRAELLGRLARAAGPDGMCSGQLLDLEAERRRFNLEETRAMQRLKTGAIIGFAVDAGAIIGGAGDDARQALARYADAIGLAFQLRDDLLDYEGSSAVTGKDAGRDAVVGKATFVELLGIEEAHGELERLRDEAFAALQIFAEQADQLRALFEFVIYRDR
ncbi:MAG: farnesyl diphosphate synthase [Pseudomonadota bacterium]